MRHPKEEDSNRRARADAARRHHRHLDLEKRESLKRQPATDGVVARSSKRRPVTNVTGIRNSPQDLQVIGRRAGNFRLFAQRQDAMMVDALGNQTSNPDALLRPDDSTADRLAMRKEALVVVFFRLNDIHMDYVESLIPPYVGEVWSERAFIAIELGKERSRFQNRFLNDMGTICKRLTKGDDSLGLFDLAFVAEPPPFWTKVHVACSLAPLASVNQFTALKSEEHPVWVQIRCKCCGSNPHPRR